MNVAQTGHDGRYYPNIQTYPCNRGMGGMGIGYHEFVNSNGAVLCRYCGHRPPAEPIRITCGS